MTHSPAVRLAPGDLAFASLVSRTRSSRELSVRTFANFRFKGTPGAIALLVLLWFGSSLRSMLRIRANFRTATRAPVITNPRGPDEMQKSLLAALLLGGLTTAAGALDM